MSIVCKKVKKSFGNLKVLDGVDAEFKDGAITAILGPSGCGKTTLLNIISGMIKADQGEISTPNVFNGTSHKNGGYRKNDIGMPVDNLSENKQQQLVSYVFQEPRLLPWKTVEENIHFVLWGAGSVLERNSLVKRYLEAVELSEFGRYYPDQLSGGMRQRAAIARAFAYEAPLMLMDEPFQALDLALKYGLIKVFTELWETTRRTVLFVTHNVYEAMLLGDDVFVLSPRPAKICLQLSNPLPPGDRELSKPELRDFEQKLIEKLLHPV